MSYIYFDQAASSFPKPETVATAVADAITNYGANPGRGGHALAIKANQVVNETRVKLAKLFGIQDSRNVFFYQNATFALNQAIKGMPFQYGDHVITTTIEHNSVRRPLEYLKKEKGIEVTYLQPDGNGWILAAALEKLLTTKTKAIIVSHASNLTGAILPIEEIGRFAKEHELTFIVDASQTAGVLPINMEEMKIDMVAFPGHKGLLGPQGTGVLIVKQEIDLQPVIHGGTGSHSEQVEQPDERPDRFESGTLNTPGIAGLSAGIDEILRVGTDQIFAHEWMLTKYCLERLNKIEGVTVFGPDLDVKRVAVIPFTIDGVDVHEVAMILDQHYQIAIRAGLHCSPIAHQTIGTADIGAIRASFGIYNTIEEIDRFIQAIEEIKVGLIG
ncbi:aminotransferase class V-fold PLP-dependent enzyme [Anaerobacillus sp. MEB173]|uniref:aminotransferase class V-fold PLP-dependent enzyme n=1 Tax=Anaerobacillus sp. MEB173 TaxID=3383345 RepID=UPI003F933711